MFCPWNWLAGAAEAFAAGKPTLQPESCATCGRGALLRSAPATGEEAALVILPPSLERVHPSVRPLSSDQTDESLFHSK